MRTELDLNKQKNSEHKGLTDKEDDEEEEDEDRENQTL